MLPETKRSPGAFIILQEYHCGYRKDNKEAKVQRCKQSDILQRLALDMRGVLAEGDKARQRGNERTYTTDINTEEQLLVVCCKLGQEKCRGHIAYHLAG